MDVPGWTRDQAVSGIQQGRSDTGLGGEPGGNGQKKGEQDNRTSYQIHFEGIILKERSGFLTAPLFNYTQISDNATEGLFV
jgi:hypothetical protein